MPASRKIIHVDMDCFYAAIEMRDFPHLATVPIAVGGDADRRGVISTCNYVARKYGVHSAMPSKQALQLCPKLVLQPVRMTIYREESQYIRQILAAYTDLIEPLSLDEAYLDVTNCSQCYGSATWIAEEIRAKIYQSRQLTASAGIAPNKSLAKIASDWHKPNGQKVIRPEEVDDFMISLPVRKLLGVGPKMEQRLRALNVKTCADLQTFSENALITKFGSYGQRLYALARGIDSRPVNPHRIRKSLSVEETYSEDLPDIDACIAALPLLLARLDARIQKMGEFEGIHNIFIKLKFCDFQQTTVERLSEIFDINIVQQLIREGYNRKQMPVRLIGVGIKLKQHDDPISQLSLPGI